MLKIIGVSFCVLLCCILVKEKNRTFYVLIALAGGVICFFVVLNDLLVLVSKINNIAQSVPDAYSYIKLMLKILCIILIAQFTSNICRDNGEGSIASLTETGVKVIVLTMTIPLFETIIEIVIGLIK